MDLEQIKKIVAYMEESSLTKIRFKSKDVEIELERAVDPKVVSYAQPQVMQHHEPPPQPAAPQVEKEKGEVITSPMVGTYYSSPAPDQPQFVKVGDKIEEGAVVCIIEAMKVMNEVKADKSGIVKEIHVHNADPVEFGTALITMEPA